MVDGSGIAGTDFNSFHVTRTGNRWPEDEVPKYIRPFRGNWQRLCRADDQIRSSELPALRKNGTRSGARSCAFGNASFDPFRDEVDLSVAQPALFGEFAVARLGEPGRHEPLTRHVCNPA